MGYSPGVNADLVLLRQIAVALVMGLLVGAEREFSAHEQATKHFAGVRTFPIIGIVGALAMHLTAGLGPWLFAAVTVGLGAMLVASHVVERRAQADVGVTTEMAALAVFLIGALAARGEEALAVILGVTITMLLSLKPFFTRVTAKVQREDVAATLKFLIIVVVVLPLLPDVDLGPFGGFNPRTVWKFVVLVSAIAFAGYVLVKVAGARRGLVLTALLGGLVSSTAVTLTFSSRSKEQPALSRTLVMGIVLASTAMFVRLAVAIGVWNRALLPAVAVPLGAMGMVTAGAALVLWLRGRGETAPPEAVAVKNPFELGTALKLGALVAVAMFAARAGQHYFGNAGVYASGVLAGVSDVDGITLTMAELSKRGSVALPVAARTVMFAVMTNTVVKGGMAVVVGARAVGRSVAVAFLLALAAGAIALWI